MVSRFVPNSVSRRQILAVTEAFRGAGGVPAYRWPGELAITKTRPLVRDEEATGTRDPFVNPQHGLPELTGTYGESLTYERLSQHMRYGLVAGEPAVGDGAVGTEAFTREHIAGDALDSVYLQYGFPGYGDHSRGVIHNEWNISGDFDDADAVWKLGSTLLVGSKDALPGTSEHIATGATATSLTKTGAAWTVNAFAGAWVTIIGGTGFGQQRQVVSNTADTLTFAAGTPFSPAPTAGTQFRVEGLFEAGIPADTGVKIAMPGTKLFINGQQILNRFVSFNVTVANQLAPKWFAENEDNPSDKMDEGFRIITGQATLERDRRDEERQMQALDTVDIRIEKEGPTIDETEGSNYLAAIDINRAAWENPSPQTRQNNYTITYGFLAYVPASDPILKVTTVTPLAALL